MVSVRQHWRTAAEWLIWVGLAAVAYTQTANFDQAIAEYSFGATGWPRTICLAIVIGATVQFASVLRRARAAPLAASGAGESVSDSGFGAGVGTQLACMGLPLVYLFSMPTLGFFVTTPVFIVALLVLLQVRSWRVMLGVTGVVCGLILLVFTRLFYVALPVGNVEPFYGINNVIVQLARVGM